MGLSCIGQPAAHEGHSPAPQLSAALPKTSLPSLDASRFVDLTSLPRPLLINFWGVDCPPCIAEMPALAEFARLNPGWTVVFISTDPSEVAKDFLARRPLPIQSANVLVVKAGNNLRGLMRVVGNATGALPYTAAWTRDSKACFAASGMLATTDLDKLFAKCSQ